MSACPSLFGIFPSLPPTSRATPHGEQRIDLDGSPPLNVERGEKDWTGQEQTVGHLRAIRPADNTGSGRLWWFLCKRCGSHVRRPPWRVFGKEPNTGHIRSCGCAQRVRP